MDKLKQYLEQHRATLDSDVPPDSIWETIQKQNGEMNAGRILSPIQRYAAAAAVLIMLIGGGVWVVTSKPDKGQNVVRLRENENSSAEKNELVYQEEKSKAVATMPEKEIPTGKKNKSLSKKERISRQGIRDDHQAESEQLPYDALIVYQLDRLRATPVYAESPAYFTGFIDHLSQMKSDEAVIKKDIERYGINEAMLESLINIYQQKLNLLKSLQKEIRQMNEAVRHNRMERSPYYLSL